MRLQTKVGLGATWPCESMVPLHPQWNPAHGQTVAHFYRRVMDLLNGVGVSGAFVRSRACWHRPKYGGSN